MSRAEVVNARVNARVFGAGNKAHVGAMSSAEPNTAAPTASPPLENARAAVGGMILALAAICGN